MVTKKLTSRMKMNETINLNSYYYWYGMGIHGDGHHANFVVFI